MPSEPRFQIRAVLELPVDVKSETAYEDAANIMGQVRVGLARAGFEVVKWKAVPFRRRLKQTELPLDNSPTMDTKEPPSC